jgi:hypothetical protein
MSTVNSIVGKITKIGTLKRHVQVTILCSEHDIPDDLILWQDKYVQLTETENPDKSGDLNFPEGETPLERVAREERERREQEQGREE